MPTLNSARHPDRSRPTTPSDRSASWTDQVWPAVIALATVIVFIVFLVQAGLLTAVVMALATVVAATVLVTLVTGTEWLTRLRSLAPHLRGHR